jgi:isopenicillin N synthase-like dioxygenase
MTYARAKSIDATGIPVIDITPLRDGSEPERIGAALHAASQNTGFIYVKGHGIPEKCINAARDSAFQFFLSSVDKKSGVAVSSRHRGWLSTGGAKMQDDAKPDLKESFIWGDQDAIGNTLEDHPMRGQNQWPAFVPDLQNHSMIYFRHVQEVAHTLMRGFALGLGLDQEFFLKSCSRPLNRASYVFYPVQPEDQGEDVFGVGPHTDFGLLTVLCQDSVGGLQVQDVNGEWINATPIRETLVVNVADLLSRWTDGAYKSTPHRVVNQSGRNRLSLVFAFDPNPETVIDPRQIFGNNYPTKHKPITCGDYLEWRFDKAFSYRQS